MPANPMTGPQAPPYPRSGYSPISDGALQVENRRRQSPLRRPPRPADSNGGIVSASDDTSRALPMPPRRPSGYEEPSQQRYSHLNDSVGEKLMHHVATEVEGMANNMASTASFDRSKQELEQQLARLQETLQNVNKHLEDEQRKAKERHDACETEKARLAHEVQVSAQRAEEARSEADSLQRELAGFRDVLAEHQKEFVDGKKALNAHFVRTGQELQDALENLKKAEDEEFRLKEANRVLQEWLDRGTEEIRRANEETDETKTLLKQTADNWEGDHEALSDRLGSLENEYKAVVHERGALAVNLTTARARVMEDSRNLHAVIPVLKELLRRCGVLESAVACGSIEPLRQLAHASSQGKVMAPDFDREGVDGATYSSVAVRNSTNELYDAFQNMHNTIATLLKAWNQDREAYLTLPQKIQAAQGETLTLKDHNDRLKLRLQELKADIEKWRQRAARAETAAAEAQAGLRATDLDRGYPAALDPALFAPAESHPKPVRHALTRLEKQQLLQAQTVATALFNEKEALQRDAEALRKENTDLRESYSRAYEENEAVKDELQRLRHQVAQQAAQFDALNVLPAY
ncbi:hypothetical protein DIPPA_56655 [Diplonema papillatum]|nr:hypothetical protein DIPPA_56655 [Diplonema papillatum]